jgi:predicted nucleic-acid-binding protein
MKITPDTNILIRAVVRDDGKQAQAATKLLKEAGVDRLIAVSLPCLCEFVRVLRGVYNFGLGGYFRRPRCAARCQQCRRQSCGCGCAGLAILHAGGDLTDGLIAYQGNWPGAETFISFDKRAVSLIAKQGQQAKLLT